MYEPEKSAIIKSKGDERMEDNELLKAIAQIVQAETKPIKEDLADVRSRMTAVETRLDSMDGRLEAVEDRLGGVENELADVKEHVTRMETRVTHVEADANRTRVLMEHDIPKQISLLAEGHTGLLKHMATSDELDAVDGRVHTLENVVAVHSDNIAALKRAAN